METRPGDPLRSEERREALAAVLRGLAEDVGERDLTTAATVAADTLAEAAIVAREQGVVAGLPVAALVFELLEPGSVRFEACVTDGERVAANRCIARLHGSAATILSGERLALNLLQQLSGTATLTRRFVDAVAGTGARIVDTRKTAPGLRRLQKYAVRMGGGTNHRFGLWDAGLIKENHIAALAAASGCPVHEVDLTAAVARMRAMRPGCWVEIEVAEPRLLDRAVAARPDAILLDNMPPEQLREQVQRARRLAAADGHPIEIEASGGITLETVGAIAAAGVDRISVGALTHSAPALDLSLRFALAPGR